MYSISPAVFLCKNTWKYERTQNTSEADAIGKATETNNQTFQNFQVHLKFDKNKL